MVKPVKVIARMLRDRLVERAACGQRLAEIREESMRLEAHQSKLTEEIAELRSEMEHSLMSNQASKIF